MSRWSSSGFVLEWAVGSWWRVRGSAVLAEALAADLRSLGCAEVRVCWGAFRGEVLVRCSAQVLAVLGAVFPVVSEVSWVRWCSVVR